MLDTDCPLLVGYLQYFRLLSAIRRDLDLNAERSGIIVQIALVETEKKYAVARGCDLAFGPDVEEVVVVIAYDRDQRTCGNVLHQLLIVIEVVPA